MCLDDAEVCIFGETQSNPRSPASGRRGYRIAEAAEYMGVSPWFIEVKIRSGELPALKLCRHYTILREDMDAFLDRQRKAHQPRWLDEGQRAA